MNILLDTVVVHVESFKTECEDCGQVVDIYVMPTGNVPVCPACGGTLLIQSEKLSSEINV